MYEFPHDFFWGAATSAHQVEGDNFSSDWWDYESSRKLPFFSGSACRHYDLYEEDFGLAKALNHNCHRLSIEWSRIEPEEGRFSCEALEHYKLVISSLRKHCLEPIVTIHHFTNPLWFLKQGGWENKRSLDYFLRYTSKVVKALSKDVRFWVTINEPLVYLYHSYLLGTWPPQEKSLIKAFKVCSNLLGAHIRSYRFIKSFYKEHNLKDSFISVAQNLQDFAPYLPTLRNKFASFLRAKLFNLNFIEKSLKAKALDFIGVNYYSRSLVELKGWGISNFIMDTCESSRSNLQKNSLGWDIYPDGLYNILEGLKRYSLPVFILENGICTDDDALRWDFIRRHLIKLSEAIASGVKVLGYIYWSLIDNYEWDKGFSPRFGLIEVDYKNFSRKIRESAKKFSKVCLEGKI
ncbi:MAG: glycoside hydrolase family 1 protein [Candidatus Omnitrophota bacterium]